MNKKVRKLELGRETLRLLEQRLIAPVAGGETGWANTCNNSCGERTRCSICCF